MRLLILVLAVHSVSCTTEKRIIGATPKDFLDVCEIPVSKTTEANVKQTLGLNTNNMVKLAKAIDRDSVDMLLDVVDEAKMMLKKKVAAVEGTIFAAVDAKRPPSSSSHDKKCAEDLMTGLRSSFASLRDVQSMTKQSVSKAQSVPNGKEFDRIHEYLNDLMAQVWIFLKDQTQGQRIRSLCYRTQVTTLIPHIVDQLQSMKPILDNQDSEAQLNTVESATGLLAQAITLNAICHGELNVDQSDEYQKEIMTKDSKISEDAANALDATIRAIIGQQNQPENHDDHDDHEDPHTSTDDSGTLADIIEALGGHSEVFRRFFGI